MLEFYYNFLRKVFDSKKVEEIEMDTDSLDLTVSGEILEDVMFPKIEMSGTDYDLNIASIISPRSQQENSSPLLAATHTRNTTRENRVSSEKKLDVPKCFVFAAKRIVAIFEIAENTKAAAKDSIKELWKNTVMDQ